jgi:hypothetical protein
MVMISAKFFLLLALLAQAEVTAPSADGKTKAKALLQEGLVFNRQGQHAQALEKFKAAYAAYPSPKLWFNIGQVEVALDHPVEAIAAFEKFLVLVPDGQPEDKKLARSTVAQLGKKLGQLKIKCDNIGAEVAVDGEKVGRIPLPEPLWAKPGSHQVTVTDKGSAAATETVEMSAGATALLVIRLLPTPSSPRLAKATPPSEKTDISPRTDPGPTRATAEQAARRPIAAMSPALDLSAQPPLMGQPSEARPIYKTWWFWTGATVVVAGAVTTAVLLTGKGGSNVPETPLGNHGVLP